MWLGTSVKVFKYLTYQSVNTISKTKITNSVVCFLCLVLTYAIFCKLFFILFLLMKFLCIFSFDNTKFMFWDVDHFETTWWIFVSFWHLHIFVSKWVFGWYNILLLCSMGTSVIANAGTFCISSMLSILLVLWYVAIAHLGMGK